jgi:RNA polymerase sigma-70 factor (ECF subfamily)
MSDVTGIGHDPDAFEAFYREHLGEVERFVARRVGDVHLAADLTADIFLAAIDACDGYRGDLGRPGAWLMGIARNVVAGELRRRQRELHAVRRISGRRLLDEDSATRIAERLDAERESRRLYAALDRLSRRDRALMELVAIDGLPVSEAAVVLGVKPATARVRLHRSRRLVHEHLGRPVPAARIEEATP